MARAGKICSYDGCPEITFTGTRCEQHTVARKDYRPSAAKRGYNFKWQEFRKKYLARNPNCVVVGCERQATDVDHIDNLGPLGPRGYDPSNLQALCHQHHSAKTAATTWAALNNQ
jgi:5-methylcytosine-specific restriction protein A